MKISTRIVAIFTSILLSQAAFAVGNTVIINNTNKTITFSTSYCNKESKLCTLVSTNYTINSHTSPKNSVELTAPLNMHVLQINGTTTLDSHGGIVGRSSGSCNVPETATAVIFNDYGTSHIVCEYGDIA